MGDVSGYYEKVQEQETEFKAGPGSRLLEKLAATINKALTDISPMAVGSVEYSMLTETQFQALKGPDWWLCDGRSCIGTAYATLTGKSNIPDKRGRFSRMKDNGAGVDPAGELALGTQLGSTIKQHIHDSTFDADSALGAALMSAIGTGTERYAGTWVDHFSEAYSVTVENSGGAENRPECITVNCFMRVN